MSNHYIASYKNNTKIVKVYLIWFNAITSKMACLSVVEAFKLQLVLPLLASLAVVRMSKSFLHLTSSYLDFGLLVLRP